jgi:hypothetical protein
MARVITSLPDTGKNTRQKVCLISVFSIDNSKTKPHRDKHWQKRSKLTASPACVTAIQDLIYDVWKRALRQADVWRNVKIVRHRLVQLHSYVALRWHGVLHCSLVLGQLKV